MNISEVSLSCKIGFPFELYICKFVPVLHDSSYVVSAHLDYAWVRIGSRSDSNAKALRAHEEEVGSAFGRYRKQNARSLD